jgi:hypothetical protein
MTPQLKKKNERFYCSKHPLYKAILKPRAKCSVCRFMYDQRGTVKMGRTA